MTSQLPALALYKAIDFVEGSWSGEAVWHAPWHAIFWGEVWRRGFGQGEVNQLYQREGHCNLEL